MNNLVAGDIFLVRMMTRTKELEKELAELKQVINKLPSRNSTALVSEIYDAIELVKAFTQAKEQSE